MAVPFLAYVVRKRYSIRFAFDISPSSFNETTRVIKTSRGAVTWTAGRSKDQRGETLFGSSLERAGGDIMHVIMRYKGFPIALADSGAVNSA